ncbi:MAG: FAD-dependent oxidoreductase [Mycobacteriaceae bacterium]|nr:FAD-dependent oxidoreductase [Mycobacteriaceae bacterium]
MAAQRFLIVGAGLAGAKAAEALREKGFDGHITLVGAEEHRPYERPPLSKGYLTGKSERESVFVHQSGWYREHRVDLRTGAEVAAIDRAGRRVRLADGSHLDYDRMLLATGARPRELPGAPGGEKYLRTLDDSDALREVLATPGARLVILGAGWIGLEAAAAAREAGLSVTVLESAELPLLKALGPEAARVFADLHTEHGVDLRLGVDVEAVSGRGVRLADGVHVEADAVLAGIGAAPNTELAVQAGLEVDNGVLTDAALRTSDPDIFAAGDVANAFHPRYGSHIRVEHWANALNQPAVAAAGMLGETAEYDRLPYFYTDQYDLGMEYHGYVGPDGYDAVVFRGDVPARQFIAFWCSRGRVLAGMNVNIWDVGDQIKDLIRADRPIDAARLADVDVPLADL